VEGFSGLVVSHNDETRCVGGPYEEGKIEGTSRERESRDTSAPRASAEMAAYTLEGFRMLHVCEELADEGKNHAELILVDLEFFASNWSSIWLRWEKVAMGIRLLRKIFRCFTREVPEVDDDDDLEQTDFFSAFGGCASFAYGMHST
jgi:hypothetical protein